MSNVTWRSDEGKALEMEVLRTGVQKGSVGASQRDRLPVFQIGQFGISRFDEAQAMHRDFHSGSAIFRTVT
jgi:hypothetical protein